MAVQDHGFGVGIEDGGFDADLGWAGVEDCVDAAVEVGEDVGRGGGADVAETVGGGRGERAACGGDEGAGDRMGGHADADEFPACGDRLRKARMAGQEERERAGPEGVHEGLRDGADVTDDGREHGRIGDVDDDRIPVGAVFGDEDRLDGGGVECVGGKAVDGLSGHGDEATVTEDGGGPFDVGCRGAEMEGLPHAPMVAVA